MKSNLILIAGRRWEICPRGDIFSSSKDWLHVCMAVMNEPRMASREPSMSNSQGRAEMYGRPVDYHCLLKMSVSSIFKEFKVQMLPECSILQLRWIQEAWSSVWRFSVHPEEKAFSLLENRWKAEGTYFLVAGGVVIFHFYSDLF